ncbi:hypothetical protein, partial [Ellagibacter isourolithinifaciens]|uniref:hypothetical protein n=1 Tax=Ellagibacter isourolithinifaciens TaxID=2137581 RepID=UPI003A94B7D4
MIAVHLEKGVTARKSALFIKSSSFAVESKSGWLQWQTQSAEVNATFAVSPAKPPDFVAVGPAVPARGPGAGGRGAR